MQIQSNLGSDIAMAFDECVENPAPYDYVQAFVRQDGYRWLARCKAENARLNALPDTVNPQQMLWGINQGGTYAGSAGRAHEAASPSWTCRGYAIGGLAVGETDAGHVRASSRPWSPICRRRSRAISWASGRRRNIIEGVARGVDFFDCVMPARNARHGQALHLGAASINLQERQVRSGRRPHRSRTATARSAAAIPGPICAICSRRRRCWPCACAVMHNLYFYNQLTASIRQALDEGTFSRFRAKYSARLAERIQAKYLKS